MSEDMCEICGMREVVTENAYGEGLCEDCACEKGYY